MISSPAGLLATALLIAAAAHAQVPTIETLSGSVKGHIASWPANGGVSEYLGIPYAQAPVGALRFAAPQSYKAGKGATHAGDRFSDSCVQALDPAALGGADEVDAGVGGYGEGMGGIKGRVYSEDCLTLNVWTKAGGEKNKAVLVWIYGGAFGAGDTAAPFYNGARLAGDQDVVVVSINYRLSIFGFPAAPGLPDLNLGLLDQRLGIEWIRDNIAKFGGDPKRITIFGESAGGASVDYFTYAWTKDPIINGIISQSGTAGSMPSTTLEKSNWWKISEKIGCGGKANGNRTVDCMREQSSSTILKALGDVTGSAAALLAFGPTVDEKIVFGDYTSKRAKGEFIKRPMLVGNTAHESGLIVGLGLSTARGIAEKGGIMGAYAAELIKYVNSWRYDNGTWGAIQSMLLPIIDSTIGCASGRAAAARRAQGVPAWRYVWMATFENTAIYPDIGAYHSIDCPVVFGAVERNSKLKSKNTPDQEKFTKNVMTAWASFAKDPDQGLVKLGWPVYDTQGSTLVQLGYQNRTEPTFASVREADKYC